MDAGLRHFLFHEVLGLSQQRAEPMLTAALERVTKGGDMGADAGEGGGTKLGNGFNPHAPYSVGVWLREQLRRADLATVAQAWHVSETEDEDELFLSGTGSITEFLKASGMPMPWGGYSKFAEANLAGGDDDASGAFEFLRDQGMLEGCDVAFHGNTLNAAQAGYFSAPRGLVHCPGTHRWFARPQVPVRDWLNAGTNVCLGTDSLASSESLSMLDMIRMTLEDNDDLTADDVLQMACSNPARLSILNKKGLSGVICGKAPADFVALKTHAFGGWESALKDSSTVVTQTLIAGQAVWSATET
jgi:cytosine/adenosine deaminase-related metal-dependent hydrolase